MLSRRILAAGAVCAGLILASPAFAFTLHGIGGKAGVTDPENGDMTPVGSIHLEFEQGGTRWHMLPSVRFWSENGVSDVNPNLDFYYHFMPPGAITPYLGAGVGVHAYSVDHGENNTDLGANVFGGLRFPASHVHFFAEARYAATDLSQFDLVGGITFHFHE